MNIFYAATDSTTMVIPMFLNICRSAILHENEYKTFVRHSIKLTLYEKNGERYEYTKFKKES